MNIHHMVAKVVDFKNENPYQAQRILEIASAVIVFVMFVAFVKLGVDSSKLVEYRINGMRAEANWMIAKAIAFMSILGCLMVVVLKASDKITKEIKLMEELEEI